MNTQTRLVLSLSLALATAATAACTDSGASQPAGKDGLGLGIEGIYKVDAYTHNATACAPGGDSALGSDTFAVVTSGAVLGVDLVNVDSCASLADCRAKAADRADGSGFLIDFTYTVDADEANGAFTGHGALTGYDLGSGTCTGGDITATTLTVSGTSLQIQQQITLALDYPADDGDVCTTTGAQAAAAGQTCSQLDNLTAELVASL